MLLPHEVLYYLMQLSPGLLACLAGTPLGPSMDALKREWAAKMQVPLQKLLALVAPLH